MTALRRLAQSASNTRREKMNSEKKKRQNLLITDKLKLIERVRKGESREAILKETGIGARTLQRFLTTEEDLKKKQTQVRRRRNERGQGNMKTWMRLWRPGLPKYATASRLSQGLYY